MNKVKLFFGLMAIACCNSMMAKTTTVTTDDEVVIKIPSSGLYSGSNASQALFFHFVRAACARGTETLSEKYAEQTGNPALFINMHDNTQSIQCNTGIWVPFTTAINSDAVVSKLNDICNSRKPGNKALVSADLQNNEFICTYA